MGFNEAENFLHDVVGEILEKVKKAKKEAETSGLDYDKGRHYGLYEAVSLISQQAQTFGLPLDRIGLEAVDVDRELL